MSVVWITGGKGFIGRYLAKFVSGSGDCVYGIGHGSWSDDEAAGWGYKKWHDGEIDIRNLNRMAGDFGLPNILYHLAGGSSVGASFQYPLDDFNRTVGSTAQLLEWLRMNAPNTCVVSISSAAVYDSGYVGPIPEDATLAPYSPYGTHKLMMESLCRSYVENFNLRVSIVRLFSVYGAGLEKQLIWDICSKLSSTQSEIITLSGTGAEVRDWLHVEDAVRLLERTVQVCSTKFSILNGGTGIASSVREMAELVCQAWGGKHSTVFSGIARKGDPESRVASIQLIRNLNFSPNISLRDGIIDTVNWFKKRT